MLREIASVKWLPLKVGFSVGNYSAELPALVPRSKRSNQSLARMITRQRRIGCGGIVYRYAGVACELRFWTRRPSGWCKEPTEKPAGFFPVRDTNCRPVAAKKREDPISSSAK